MTGYLANLALPRIGEITRCVALGKKEKIPVDQLIGTVVVERTIDLLSLLIIMFALIISRGEQINQFLKASIFDPLQEKVLSLFEFTWIIWIIVIILCIISIFFLIRYRKSLRKTRFFSRFFDLARGIINGFRTITNLKRKWEFVFLAADENGIQDGRAMGTTNYAYNIQDTKHIMRAAGMAVMNYCSTGLMGNQIDDLKDKDSK